ncbi:MAG TPA: mechanosensitive ion channel domain-containing protein, partial [Candidatus Acidoferrum sp.]|nr:mechanosensitive ion channel domain-containing protein [Candidatus Acidoferrum sp.]
MKRLDKAILISLLALLVVALGAVVFTRSWADYRNRLHLLSRRVSEPVDMRPLETAQQLAQLAVTHIEKDYAQQALRLGDRSVDSAFAAAVDAASENPTPLTPQTRGLAARVKADEAAVAADQGRITHFTAALAQAQGPAKDALEELITIAQAQLALDQDDLEAAQQDLTSAGGDKQAAIKQLLDQHTASDAHNASMQVGAPAATSATELTREGNVVAAFRAWASLRTKENSLKKAEQEALARASTLSEQHDALEKQLEEGAPASPSPSGSSGTDSPLVLLRRQTLAKKTLAGFATRIQTERQLAAIYAQWIDLVNARAKGFLHEIFVSSLWIVVIVLLVFTAHYFLKRFFAQMARERREIRTIDTVVLLSVQAVGVILILLVIFGIPNNFATVLALAGAGLTVALKDFIVGFLGWFVLIGKDGIRVGDWVEINGVGGEVLKLGPLHTVVLETGNWTDAGHPTGRKVSFVNSFAIEGHYFNFSTSGQWLWDEIELQVPASVDPYAMAEAIQEIAA